MMRLVIIDLKRAWRQFLPKGVVLLDLTHSTSARRVCGARAQDVLIIHVSDGVEDDRTTLAAMPANARPRVILVTAGAEATLSDEWKALATGCEATIVPYLGHFHQVRELRPEIIKMLTSTLERSLKQCHSDPTTMQQSPGKGNGISTSEPRTWTDLARADLHFIGKSLAAKCALGPGRFLVWIDGSQNGVCRRQWLAERIQEIQRQWTQALRPGGPRSNPSSHTAKKAFDQNAKVFISCVQAFRADQDCRSICTVFEAMHQAAQDGLKGL